ncbi:histidine kinase A domain protein [Clostridium sp. CAG:632]|nr:histidine kinase A domain protein [Clostridium sp. CAG:632]
MRMKNVKKMPGSAVAKKIIKIINLGIVLVCSLLAMVFFVYMGSMFGYKDLDCESYLETRRFADSLWQIMSRISGEIAWTENYVDEDESEISISDLTYDSNKGMAQGGVYAESLQDLALKGDYEYTTDDFGIWNISGAEVTDADGEEVQFNDSWYQIALSNWEIKQADGFVRMSHDDYVRMFMAHATPNVVVEESSGDAVADEEASGSLTVSIEAKNDGGATEAAVYGTEVVAADLEPSVTRQGPQDAEFSDDCYIAYYGGTKFVYSPDEDMFYSSEYGWYPIPNELYFLPEEVSDNEMELYFSRFTGLGDILRLRIGGEYLEYVRSVKDINFNERNLAYYVRHNGKVYSNVTSREKATSCSAYMTIQKTASDEYEVQFSNFKNTYISSTYVTSLMQNLDSLTPDDKLYIGIYTTYPYEDTFRQDNQIFSEYYSYTFPALVIGVVTAIAAIWLFVHILRRSGRISGDDTAVYLTPIDRIPVEILFIVGLAELIVIFAALESMAVSDSRSIAEITSLEYIMVVGCFEGLYLLGITWLLSIVRQVKAGCLWQHSLIRSGYIFCRKLVQTVSRQKNLAAKTAECFAFYLLINGVLILMLILGVDNSAPLASLGALLLIIGFNVYILILQIRKAKGEESIREATKALAEGDLEYVAPKMKRLYTEQEIIDNIDHLSDGLHKAIEKSLYDERMKTELITNVSHDIKTPLTSIINYVELIKREEVDNEKVQHYLEVLDKKSQRLKQLTEDLVEVSRISSGNIELERVPIDFGELLRQAMGEFEDKFTEHELKMVERIPEEAHMIFADGRRTFRIMDNLLQNIYKYAMPGTRVYIDLTCENERVRLEIKNISKAPLNIEVSELMERFVRGDQSRTTEGSGLGLSIARDLVRMQDGEFQIYLDGDLFKVVIEFPEYISPVVVNMEEAAVSEENQMPVLEKTDSQKEES